MIVSVRAELSIKRRVWDFLGRPSEAAKGRYNVLLSIILFFIAQILTCAWDQPFWAADLNFPGQIAAMLFVWLIMWVIQVLFFRPGEGLEWFYRRYIRAPVSSKSLGSQHPPP